MHGEVHEPVKGVYQYTSREAIHSLSFSLQNPVTYLPPALSSSGRSSYRRLFPQEIFPQELIAQQVVLQVFLLWCFQPTGARAVSSSLLPTIYYMLWPGQAAETGGAKLGVWDPHSLSWTQF